jgi:hypothetical protein
MRGPVIFAGAAALAVLLGAPSTQAADKERCKLDNRIEHIVYIQFDNSIFVEITRTCRPTSSRCPIC